MATSSHFCRYARFIFEGPRLIRNKYWHNVNSLYAENKHQMTYNQVLITFLCQFLQNFFSPFAFCITYLLGKFYRKIARTYLLSFATLTCLSCSCCECRAGNRKTNRSTKCTPEASSTSASL